MWTDVLSWALPVAIAVIVVAVSLHSIRKNRGKKRTLPSAPSVSCAARRIRGCTSTNSPNFS